MWNKRNEEGPGPRPQFDATRSPAPATVPPAPVAASHRVEPVTMTAPEPASPKSLAAIGASMHIKGEIRTREQLLVDGEVEGVLESQSLVTVGPNGRVKANIKAREVIIYGSLHGNVDVTEKIAIREQGSLVGDIKAAGISIDDGAYFKGSIDIIRPEPKVTTRPVQAEPKIQAVAG